MSDIVVGQYDNTDVLTLVIALSYDLPGSCGLPAAAASGESRIMTTIRLPRAAAGRSLRLTGAARYLPGLLVVGVVATVATIGGRIEPLLGGPVIGVILGAMLSPWVRRRGELRLGITLAATVVLQVSVVVLGAQLSIKQVLTAGADSLPVMLGTLAACLIVAQIAGRWLGISGDLRTLIGCGTAICGASAIAAVSPTIRAKNPDIAYAITTIFVFNIVAVLVFPPLGHALGMSQHDFGLFAGTAVNDTSSVVATASTYGDVASHEAVVVKLTRTLMIIPICLVLGALTRRRTTEPTLEPVRSGGALRQAVRLVPWFLIGFLVLAGINSAGAIPAAAHSSIQFTALTLITVALTAIGMSTDTAALRRAGFKPFLLGLILWATVGGTSLLLQLA